MPMAEPQIVESRQQFAEDLARFQETHRQMLAELGKVIIGQREVIDQMLAALFCNAHCLLVGVPGLAKTMIVRSLSEVLQLSFKRIQFTPDLMPSDITGTNVIDEDPESGRRDFKFLPGPVFANVLLADEINRTPPKTQAALLEAMQERQVSIGNQTYPLPSPFFVIATQNPIEQEGTYPLPEAQQDRFMFNIHVDYPSPEEETEIYRFTTHGKPAKLRAILGADDIARVQDVVDRIVVSDYVLEYVTALVRATRPKTPEAPKFVKEYVDWGAGPRAGQYLIKGGKAIAAMEGRVNVSCEDVRRVAVPVLRHRIGTNFQAESSGIDAVQLVELLLKEVREPKLT
ncbi:MAG: MoxR family ATPase [Planctomycetota bacterium]|nr:MoxR family ATPase [Planctomycetota bacterium]